MEYYGILGFYIWNIMEYVGPKTKHSISKKNISHSIPNMDKNIVFHHISIYHSIFQSIIHIPSGKRLHGKSPCY